jgi:AraC family transcriptional regulator
MSRRTLRDRENLLEDAVGDLARAAHASAVERVVATMRERLGEALTLQDLADVAHLSPYYFARVFRDMTGIPPAEYLAALRVQEAKRLLLTTQASVTDVCFEVGYTGLGTFTARFARLVGVSPGRLRRRAEDVDGLVAGAPPYGAGGGGAAAAGGGVNGGVNGGVGGVVHAPDTARGLIFVGLFPTPIPQSTPVGSALLDGPGAYHIPCVPDGRYYALAAAFPPTARADVSRARRRAARRRRTRARDGAGRPGARAGGHRGAPAAPDRPAAPGRAAVPPRGPSTPRTRLA